jgi:uncharacterized membrane protein YeaQ/YmgE (transglycosylase-associated protein family)
MVSRATRQTSAVSVPGCVRVAENSLPLRGVVHDVGANLRGRTVRKRLWPTNGTVRDLAHQGVTVNMSVVGWIVLGLIAGIVAKHMLGSRAKHGVIVSILIGVAGALGGGWAASELFGITATGGFFDLSTWLVAIVGSVVLLGIYYAITNRGCGSSRGSSRRHGVWRARR